MPNRPLYRIEVLPEPQFLPEQSSQDDNRFVFAYTITIRNTGQQPAQLISRHWIITDGDNKIQEVRGLGVVGEQPMIKPGESYQYTSGCALTTPVGTMKGTYQMVGEDGSRFEAEIPEFVLAIPRVLH
ncbi:MAG: Co2+/Mg2+ efflux protein ApaG [Rhodocyclales bacterium]|nr:Co2+/Mg2+ efflux protein ApaG [Rhodocyclales bacterium]